MLTPAGGTDRGPSLGAPDSGFVGWDTQCWKTRYAIERYWVLQSRRTSPTPGVRPPGGQVAALRDGSTTSSPRGGNDFGDGDAKKEAVGDPDVALGSRVDPVEAAVAGRVVAHAMNPCSPDAPGMNAVSLGACAPGTDGLGRRLDEDPGESMTSSPRGGDASVGCGSKAGAVGDPRVSSGSRTAPVEAVVAGPVVEPDMSPCRSDAPGMDADSLSAGAKGTDELDLRWAEDPSLWYSDPDHGVEVYDCAAGWEAFPPADVPDPGGELGEGIRSIV